MINLRHCIVILISVLPSTLAAQSPAGDIPWQIKIRFMEDYISASSVSWKKDTGDKYVADFYHHSHYKIAKYSNGGSRLVTEIKLASMSQVPVAVVKSLSTHFKNFIIDERVKVETSQSVSFRFVVRKKCKI